jgi:hypothetical protein
MVVKLITVCGCSQVMNFQNPGNANAITIPFRSSSKYVSFDAGDLYNPDGEEISTREFLFEGEYELDHTRIYREVYSVSKKKPKKSIEDITEQLNNLVEEIERKRNAK